MFICNNVFSLFFGIHMKKKEKFFFIFFLNNYRLLKIVEVQKCVTCSQTRIISIRRNQYHICESIMHDTDIYQPIEI